MLANVQPHLHHIVHLAAREQSIALHGAAQGTEVLEQARRLLVADTNLARAQRIPRLGRVEGGEGVGGVLREG